MRSMVAKRICPKTHQRRYDLRVALLSRSRRVLTAGLWSEMAGAELGQLSTSMDSSTRRPRSPTRAADGRWESSTAPTAAAGWGHWMSDGLATTDLPSPRRRYTTTSRSSSPVRGERPGPTSTSLFDGIGSDRTRGLPDLEAEKIWSSRSFSQMADFGTVPSGLPRGISDSEKKLWLAIYVKAREMLLDGSGTTVRSAVDGAIRAVTEKHSLEYRFGIRWSHSVKTCLAMRLSFSNGSSIVKG